MSWAEVSPQLASNTGSSRLPQPRAGSVSALSSPHPLQSASSVLTPVELLVLVRSIVRRAHGQQHGVLAVASWSVSVTGCCRLPGQVWLRRQTLKGRTKKPSFEALHISLSSSPGPGPSAVAPAPRSGRRHGLARTGNISTRPPPGARPCLSSGPSSQPGSEGWLKSDTQGFPPWPMYTLDLLGLWKLSQTSWSSSL